LSARVRTAVRAGVGASALAAAVVLSSCGVPTGGGAQAIPRQGVPFGLLTPSSTTPSARPGAAGTVGAQVYFYFVKTLRLAPEVRLVRPPATPSTAATLSTTIQALLMQPPTDAEVSGGVETAIPGQTSLLSAEVTPSLIGDIAVLNLSSQFSQASGDLQVLAVAQLVYTATNIPGVVGVTFELSGQPVQVPAGNGQLVPASTPVGKADYAEQAP
jgi:spore germination protein GerM